jgi:hypothetical protein
VVNSSKIDRVSGERRDQPVSSVRCRLWFNRLVHWESPTVSVAGGGELVMESRERRIQ